MQKPSGRGICANCRQLFDHVGLYRVHLQGADIKILDIDEKRQSVDEHSNS
jgi:hypothetical protein